MTAEDLRTAQLRDWFAFMVPHYIEDLRRTGQAPLARARELASDGAFMRRLTYCEDMLHGPFDQDRNRSKDAYAEVIAVMSCMPGGVTVWGLHFEASRGPFFVERVVDNAPMFARDWSDFGPLFGGLR